MRRIFLFLLVVGFSIPAQANLINNLDGTITQVKADGTRLMWMQDANYAYTSGFDPDGTLTNAAAVNWASSLAFAGYSDWRLPVTYQNAAGSGGYNTTSEMGELYYNDLGNTGGSFANAGPFFNIQPYWYWTGTVFVDPNFVMVFSFLDIPNSPTNEAGWEDAGDRYAATWTWLVRDVTDTAPVPEPSALALLGLGVAGLGFIRRKRN